MTDTLLSGKLNKQKSNLASDTFVTLRTMLADKPQIVMHMLEQQEAEEYRYKLLEEAFQECVANGVSKQSLITLAYETGFNKVDLGEMIAKDN